MVLPNIFKASAKKKDSETTVQEDIRPSASPPRSPSRSPKKSSTHSFADRNLRPSSPRHQKSSTRSSRSPRKVTSDYPRDTHPLNLPPEERERRRSAFSATHDSYETMELDQEAPAGAPPSSPPPTPGGFSNSNGVEPLEGLNGNGSPIPPPHRIPPEAPPPPKPTTDAEACKVAGNKFFKMQDYDKAIREYSKGTLECSGA